MPAEPRILAAGLRYRSEAGTCHRGICHPRVDPRRLSRTVAVENPPLGRGCPPPTLRPRPLPTMPAPPPTPPSLRRKVILSAAWLIGTRWVLRLLGLASTMLLARLLMPEDFGVVAAVTAVVAILNGFFEFGFNLALIRATEYRREDYDTAWTLRILKSSAFAALVFAVSPLVADYADDPNIVLISAVVALGLVVRGFDNIGTVRFEREMQYQRLFAVRLYPRLAGVVATLALAFWLRSYWAIVLGVLVQQVAYTAFSFALCSFRPRFRLEGAASLWNFSKWIVANSISRQIYSALDRFTLSGLVSKRDLGFFSVSSSVAAMVTSELVGAAGSALIPGYAKLKDEPQRLREAFLTAQSALFGLLLPVTLALVILAKPATITVLGWKWVDAAPMLAAFAAFYLAYTLVENLNSFMAVTDLQQSAAKTGIVRTLVFLGLVYPMFQAGGILLVIGMKAALSTLEFVWLAWQCCRRVQVSPALLWRRFLRPVAAAGAMALVMLALRPAAAALPPPAQLLAIGATGLVVYLVTALVIWRCTGRPGGLEHLLVEAAQKVAARVRR